MQVSTVDRVGSTAANAVTPRLSDVHVPELDGVRGLAVLFIVVWHYVGIPLPPAGVSQAHHWIPSFKGSLIIFRTGVDLFFVLSGFLIGGILMDHRESGAYYRTFYARRVLRIFPIYFALLLIFAVSILLGAHGPLFDGPIPMFAYVTMTQNYFMSHFDTYGALWLGATWSLAVEEQFYLGFPLIIRRARVPLPWLFVAGIVGAPALRIACYYHYHNDFAADTWLPCRLDDLCWGALIAYAMRSPRSWTALKHRRRQLWGAFAILVAAPTLLDAALARDVGFHMSMWGHTTLALLYACFLLVVVVDAGTDATRFLRQPVLRYLGQISYATYLVHGIVLAAFFQIVNRGTALDSLADVSVVLAALFVTLIIAALSYRYFERPALRLGRRFIY